MAAHEGLRVLKRPDWVLHLPPTPVHNLPIIYADYVEGSDTEDDNIQPYEALEWLCRDINELNIEDDEWPSGLKSVDLADVCLQDVDELNKYIIQPLSGNRKIRLPKTWLKVIENGFRYESTASHGTANSASDETRRFQQLFPKHPNADLKAQEQKLEQWLTVGENGLRWDRRALGHGLSTLELRNCNLNAGSIPTLVSYIEGNGSLSCLDLRRERTNCW